MSHSYILCTLIFKVFVVKISSQKNLCKHSLWVLERFFAQETKSWIFFQDLVRILKLVQSWHAMHKIVFSNVSIHEKNQTFNMNVPLSYNNIFKWGGPLEIRSLTVFFGTPTMLWPQIICKINHEALKKWHILWKWTYKNNAMLCCKHKCKLMFVR